MDAPFIFRACPRGVAPGAGYGLARSIRAGSGTDRHQDAALLGKRHGQKLPMHASLRSALPGLHHTCNEVPARGHDAHDIASRPRPRW
jgi:hypothetical protein